MTTTWSPYQDAIFRFITDDAGNASIEAVAGSGKTTTIVEAAKRLPPTSRALFLAFNKSIALELAARLPANVEAKTLNALGHGAWMRYTGKRTIKLNTDKTRDIIRDVMSETEQRIYTAGVRKLVALAKTIGLVPDGMKTVYGGLAEDTDEEWMGLIDWYDVDFGEGARIDHAIDLAREVLEKSIYTAVREIDFDDQIYMTVIMRAPMIQYDFVFVDEAQDLNAMQRQMLRMSLKPNGRLIAVGDPHQAIYGFRGADSQSMPNLANEFKTTTLPLSISYRCPKLVVAEAQRFVSHIQSHEDAPDGEVVHLGDKFSPQDFNPQDAIVCRANAPIITLAFRCLREKIPVRVLGREIGAGLTALIKKMRACDLQDLDARLLDFQAIECDKFMRRNMDQKAEALMDKVATIQVFIDGLEPHQRTIDDLIQLIESLFTDNDKGRLTLCTIHKAKGLEWHHVYVLNPHLMPSKYAKQDWQKAQETNIQYVAVTRARHRLAYISTEEAPKKAV